LIPQFYKKHANWQLLPGLFLLIALGLCIPKVVSAQTIPPPLPIEQRWESEFQNRPTGQDEPRQPDFPESRFFSWSRVAFQSYRDGNWEIYAGEDDFLTPARLTNDGGSDIQPRINRGATSIVFASNRDGDYEIFRMNFDGSGLARLTDNTSSDVYPIWSPDGTKILFQSDRDGQSEIYVMNADGSGQTRLTNDPNYDGQPDWSPDGSKILFSSYRSGGYRIWVANADGSNPIMLSSQSNSSHPKWSPDGSRIAYDADGNGNGWQELWIMNADGSNPYCAAQSPYSNTDYWAGSWSPTGDYLAYTSVEYIYYQNNWYWTNANLYALAVKPYGETSKLGDKYTEWNPDWQTMDANAPTSSMTALPAQSPASFLVSWTGNDTGYLGSINGYEVQVKDGLNGAWVSLLKQTQNTSVTYLGIGGHTYYFRVRAWDGSYNLESWPTDYDTFTTVEALPPVTSVNALPPFSRSGFTVTWSGTDPGESGITKYDVQYRIGTDGTWTDWQINTQATSAVFNELAGQTYYFRSRATDHAQNIEPWPVGNGDTQVTIYFWNISGVIHDNVGLPIADSPMILNPAPVRVFPSDGTGKFSGYGMQEAPGYTAVWFQNGYGNLPATTFSANIDVQLEIALPPVDNLIRDGNFESGGILPENWKTTGTLPVSIVNTTSHTGQFATRLGYPPSIGWENIEKLGFANVGPRLVVDSRGIAHAVWIMRSANPDVYETQIYYSSKPKNGTWTTPVSISDIVTNHLDIVVDHLDNLHLVWHGDRIYYLFKPKEGNWTKSIKLFDRDVLDTQIVIDANDTIHLIGKDVNVTNSIMYAYRANGIWSTLAHVSSTGSQPSLAVDHAGTIHVLWAECSVNWEVYYSYKPLNGSWSPAMQVSSNGGWEPELIVDSMDTLYGVWPALRSDNYTEFRTKPLNKNWEVPEKIETTQGPLQQKIVANPEKVEMVYTGGDGNGYRIYYIERKRGMQWTQRMMISSNLNASVGSNIALGPDGVTHIAWFEETKPGPTGATGEIRYRRSVFVDQTSDALLTQTLTIPDTIFTPTLSFFYQLEGGEVQIGAGLAVNLQTTAGSINLALKTTNTSGWTFQSLDLTPWRGQTVTLEFRAHQVAGGLPVLALIDDVSLGSAYSDIWGSTSSVFGYPGDEVTYMLNCGNQGGVAANHTQMTVELPSDLTFVSAVPAPTNQTPVLTWDLGNLPPKSTACSVRLTVKIGPTVTIPKSLISQVKLTTASAELETGNNLIFARVIVPLNIYLPKVTR
jgi:TolB protein